MIRNLIYIKKILVCGKHSVLILIIFCYLSSWNSSAGDPWKFLEQTHMQLRPSHMLLKENALIVSGGNVSK